MRRRAAALAMVALCAVVVASPAAAHWAAGGAGSGLASVATLAAGNQPTTSISAQSVTVEWSQVSFGGSALGTYAGGGYTIQRYPASGGAAVTPNAGCDTLVRGATATLSCREDNVPPGSWRYAVTPVLASWTGAESAPSGLAGVAPPAPSLQAVTAQNPAAGQATGPVQLAWSAVTGATGYNLYRRTSSGAYDFSAPLNGAVPLTAGAYTDPGSGLTGGTSYGYVVRAVTGTLASVDSNELTATAIARPVAPTGVTAAPAAGGPIGVSWSDAAGAAGYNVYRRTAPGSYDYAAPLNGSTPTTGTSWTDATTANGVGYRYVVRAVITGAGGVTIESLDSPESALATSDAVAPGSVSLTNPGSPLRGTITVSGTATDAGSGIATVRFQYTATGGSTWTTGCTSTTSPYTCSLDTAPLTDGLYDLRVLATDTAGNQTASSVITGRRVDNTAPAATLSDPGAYLRATIAFSATATDSGSGVATLRIQRAATGTGSWSDVCTGTTGTLSCTLNTTTVTDGGYDFRVLSTDLAGNAYTSTPVVNRIIDNAPPSGVDVQSSNAPGGTAAKPETGDVITYTFSEPMKPASIMAGWTGAATPVVVRFTNGNPDVITVFNAANTVQTALGSVTSGKKYVTANTTFTASSMVLSGNSISVTLGTPSGVTATANGTTTLQWTTSTAATDLAGNPLAAGTLAETGVTDFDF